MTETTIHSWVRQADLDGGRRQDGLTTEEQEISLLHTRIKSIHEMSDGTDGAPRIQAELADVESKTTSST